MGETANLVSWYSAEEQGKIPGSDWICPIGSADALGDFERKGGTVTDEVIRSLADGQAQHLEIVKFPEGYQAAKVVDSETGRVLTAERHTNRYGGLVSCNCGAIHNMASVAGVLSGRPISLGEGVKISSVYNFSRGTETVIKPSEVDETEPDHISRLRTFVQINPGSRDLFVTTDGRAATIERGYSSFEVREKDLERKGKLEIGVNNDWGSTGQLNLDLGTNGQVEKMMVYKRGFLEMLGVNVDLDISSASGWGEVIDSGRQALVLDALAEALGFDERWQGLDLKLTASGVYAAMGRRNFDPVTALVPLN